jgi:hypothetical protein
MTDIALGSLLAGNGHPVLHASVKRVLVCGGRSFADIDLLNGVLDKLSANYTIECIIEGDAPGADRMAGTWARSHGIPNFKFAADWKAFGRAAGPKRNSKMLELHPNLVIAFPGSRGTADMVGKAKNAGIEVVEISAQKYA